MMHTPMDWPVLLSERLERQRRETDEARGLCSVSMVTLWAVFPVLTVVSLFGPWLRSHLSFLSILIIGG